MSHASTLVTFALPALALTVAVVVVVAVWHASSLTDRRRDTLFVAGAATAWLALTGALAAAGFYSNWEARPPRGVFLLLPTLVLPLWLGSSRIGAALARNLSFTWLMGFHVFRLPLELVMHRAAVEGTMPSQMTYTGWNFDILTGVLALGVILSARFSKPSRTVAIVFGVVGTALLTTIVGIAVASLPNFHAFGTDPRRLNTWVAAFPFVWLPAGLVASAVLGHTVLWRKIWLERA